MPNDLFGANELTVEELDALFVDDEVQQDPPPATQDSVTDQPASTSDADDVPNTTNSTKAFAKRLRESTEKARREERESIAKSLGYESFDAMQKQHETKILNDKGLNPEEVSPVIDELVKQRINNDPRMLELSDFKQQREKEFAKKELAEITKLTNGEITSLKQLSEDVLDSWRTEGSLVKAYMKHEGVNLVAKIRNENTKGSTAHLSNPSNSLPSQPKTRPLTAEEKQAWKVFYPNISDEELNKKTINI
jgi:hypothetical protein